MPYNHNRKDKLTPTQKGGFTMYTEEIKKQIEELEDELFELNLIDRFTRKERNRQVELYSKLAVLKNKLYYEEKQNT